MTEILERATLPTSAADPFGHEVLEDPLPLHAALRDAGPVVYLQRYGVYAMARYEQVHAALRDWQSFQSGAGVGLSNFRTEKPWRPPSLLLEADPPRHDAPRRVLSGLLVPRALRRLRAEWTAAAHELVDRLLAAGPEFDAVPALAEAFPLRVFPDAVGIPVAGRENLLPYGDFLFNAFGPHNDLVAAGAARAPELSAWVNAQCARDVLAEGGFGAQIWAAADRGEITAEQAPLVVRSLLSAGVTPPCTGWPRCCTRWPPTPSSGGGCGSGRRWPGSRSTRRCAGPRRCRRSSARPPPRCRSVTPWSRTGRRS